MSDDDTMLDSLNIIAQQVAILKTLLAEREPRPVRHEPNTPSIAEQIVAWREFYAWTQEDLATKIGTVQPVISQFENRTYQGHTIRSLHRLADAFGTILWVRFLPKDHRELQPWQAMDTAPKDGRAILLLSKAYTAPSDINGDPYYHPAQIAIGHWNPEGTAWVDEMGRLDGEAYRLAVTGVWFSGSGWFQPNEVTHWMPLPEPPAVAGEVL